MAANIASAAITEVVNEYRELLRSARKAKPAPLRPQTFDVRKRNPIKDFMRGNQLTGEDFE